MNIYPQETEDVLIEGWLEAELILFCRTKLSAIRCPKSIDFEAELPRTPTGKLVKRHLRDKYWPKSVVRV